MTTSSILFVDDEEGILLGLNRATRRRYRDWKVFFALGGDEGLKVLEAERIDIIVSDMRMPRMDGAEFLENARNLAPLSVRFILSGEAERGITLRALRVSHQFFAKPIDTDQLASRAQLLMDARNKICNAEFLNSILTADTICEPNIAISDNEALSEKLKNGVDEAIDCLERSCAVSTKLIQIANSAYFGIGRPVIRPGDGAAALGAELLCDLIEGGHLFETPSAGVDSAPGARPSLAVTARAVAENLHCSDVDVAAVFTAAHFVEAALRLYDGRSNRAACETLSLTELSSGAAFFAALWGAPVEVVSLVSGAQENAEATSPQNILRVVAAASLLNGASLSEATLTDALAPEAGNAEEMNALVEQFARASSSSEEAA